MEEFGATSILQGQGDAQQRAVSAFPEEAAGQWFVLHTKSRQEKAIARTLDAMGVAHFLPLVKRISYQRQRRFTVQVPMFPSYLFLCGELDDAYMADRTNRITRVIRAVDQEQIRKELRNIHLALTKEAPLNPYPYLNTGIWVEVRSGPFEGLQGIIEDRAKVERLVLQVEMMGQATSLEIDGALLDPIE